MPSLFFRPGRFSDYAKKRKALKLAREKAASRRFPQKIWDEVGPLFGGFLLIFFLGGNDGVE